MSTERIIDTRGVESGELDSEDEGESKDKATLFHEVGMSNKSNPDKDRLTNKGYGKAKGQINSYFEEASKAGQKANSNEAILTFNFEVASDYECIFEVREEG